MILVKTYGEDVASVMRFWQSANLCLEHLASTLACRS